MLGSQQAAARGTALVAPPAPAASPPQVAPASPGWERAIPTARQGPGMLAMLIRLSVISCSQPALFTRFWTPCLPIQLKSNIYWRCSTQAALGCVSAFSLNAFFRSPRLSHTSAVQADILHTPGSDVEQTWGGENLNISYKESGKIPACCSEKNPCCYGMGCPGAADTRRHKTRGRFLWQEGGRNVPCGWAESVQGGTGVCGGVREQKPQPRAELSPA